VQRIESGWGREAEEKWRRQGEGGGIGSGDRSDRVGAWERGGQG